jgi:hypothetical protein
MKNVWIAVLFTSSRLVFGDAIIPGDADVKVLPIRRTSDSMGGETPEEFKNKWMHQFSSSVYAGTIERSNRLVQYIARISLLPAQEQSKWLTELALLVETLPNFEQECLFHRIQQLTIPALRKKKYNNFLKHKTYDQKL